MAKTRQQINADFRARHGSAYFLKYEAKRVGQRNDYWRRRKKILWQDPIYRQNDMNKSAAWHRKRGTGVDQATYDAMFEKQQGRCAICNKPPNGRQLCADHCHHTKKARGLLCIRCNVALGMLNDDPELVTKALEYLSWR